jgi:GNAT superfamily N-acetyltransferase
MQAHSFRALGAPFYEPDVIEAYIAGIGTMDDALIDDGTYFVATASDGRIAGSGGWSRRTPTYAARVRGNALPAAVATATVRSIYVDPDFARRGIARAIMAAIESEIVAAGFGAASLMATLSGIPLYRRLGYRSGMPLVVNLAHGLAFVGLEMTKQVASSALKQADRTGRGAKEMPACGALA